MAQRARIIMLIGDGMADHPVPALGGRTPLEAAACPNMDAIARAGRGGLIETVAEGLKPGSDIAIMSVLGYDPKKYYTGRGPLEAAALGIALEPGDVCFRCNLVTLRDGRMASYSGGNIRTADAAKYIAMIDAKFGREGVRFHPGVSYRHLLVVPERLLGADGTGLKATPPHDISEQPWAPHLPAGPGSAFVRQLMADVNAFLQSDPAACAQRAAGNGEANAVWLWGHGTSPALPTFAQRFGIETGAAITAVDLIRGIARLAGLDVPEVPGATGYYDTNYAGKAGAAVRMLADHDFVVVHVEAPDEAGHNGELDEKIRAIENFDREIVGPVWRAAREYPRHALVVLPDHPTPLDVKTHVREKVPFAVCGSGIAPDGSMAAFSEPAARNSPWNTMTGLGLIEWMKRTTE
ncbi:cofactor-independent phosphoglycerate mutase [bacterium]|nr:cofactor-independent phosphoglycerate mutase [bacterium]